MFQKLSHRTQFKEDKVEDLYGVHFKYQDLYSRLLKVQRERQISERKTPLPRIPSIDITTVRKGSEKRTMVLRKPSGNLQNAEKRNARSTSIKKMLIAKPVTDRKYDVFKSFSPLQTREKKLSEKFIRPLKKIDGKASSTMRLTKRILEKMTGK